MGVYMYICVQMPCGVVRALAEAMATREVDSAGFQTLVLPQMSDSASCVWFRCGGFDLRGSINISMRCVIEVGGGDMRARRHKQNRRKKARTPTHVPEVDGVGEVEGGDDAHVALEGVPALHHDVPGPVRWVGVVVVRTCVCCVLFDGRR